MCYVVRSRLEPIATFVVYLYQCIVRLLPPMLGVAASTASAFASTPSPPPPQHSQLAWASLAILLLYGLANGLSTLFPFFRAFLTKLLLTDFLLPASSTNRMAFNVQCLFLTICWRLHSKEDDNLSITPDTMYSKQAHCFHWILCFLGSDLSQ